MSKVLLLVKNRKVQFFSLSSAHFVNDLYHGFLPALLPLLVSRFSLPLTLVASLMALWSFTSGFSQTLFGFISDRLKGIHCILLGLVLSSVATAIFYAPRFEWVAFLVILGGLGTGLFHPQAYSITGKIISMKKKNLGISTFSSLGSFGYAIGPVFATVMISWNSRYFYLAVIPALIVVSFLFFSVSPVCASGSMRREAQKDCANLNSWKLNFGSMCLIWFVMVIKSLTVLSIISFLSILWEEGGMSTVQRGELLSLWLLLGGVGSIAGGYASDRFGKKITIVSSLVLAVVFFLLFLRGSGILRLVFLMASGIALFASTPSILVMGHELAPKNTGMVSGMLMGLAPAVGSLFLPIVGLLADYVGIAKALEIVIILLTITIPLVLVASKEDNPIAKGSIESSESK